jgi:hypothetical protein
MTAMIIENHPDRHEPAPIKVYVVKLKLMNSFISKHTPHPKAVWAQSVTNVQTHPIYKFNFLLINS